MIKAGLELIRKEGFAAFSARKVAAEVGYTVGSIYHVFGSYDMMLLHINGETLDALYKAISKALERQPRKDALLVLAEAYYAFASKEYALWSCLFEYRLSENTEIPDWYRDKLKSLFVIIEEQLSSFCLDNKKQCRRHAKILWAGIHGICTLALSGRMEVVGSDPSATLIETFTTHYIAGLEAYHKA